MTSHYGRSTLKKRRIGNIIPAKSEIDILFDSSYDIITANVARFGDLSPIWLLFFKIGTKILARGLSRFGYFFGYFGKTIQNSLQQVLNSQFWNFSLDDKCLKSIKTILKLIKTCFFIIPFPLKFLSLSGLLTVALGRALDSELIWSQSWDSIPGPPSKKLPLCHLSYKGRRH